jgi:hypothetical protein
MVDILGGTLGFAMDVRRLLCGCVLERLTAFSLLHPNRTKQEFCCERCLSKKATVWWTPEKRPIHLLDELTSVW